MRLLLLFIALLLPGLLSAMVAKTDTIDLAGSWHYTLKGAPVSIPGEGSLILPGTLDEQHKSIYISPSNNTSQLRTEFSFIGEATYSKRIDIPANWNNKNITLVLERTKPSTIKIDSQVVGSSSRISSPQIYDLSSSLTPGSHLIEIIVNNADSIPPGVALNSNAASEATQTNWNGIIGDLKLIAKDPFHISGIVMDDNRAPGSVAFFIDFSAAAPADLNLEFFINDELCVDKKIPKDALSLDISIALDEVGLWSASHPRLHDIEIRIRDNNEMHDRYEFTTGFRSFTTSAKNFMINDNTVFLRGTVNSALFPVTAYSPMDPETWENYFEALKEYGINHVRFHSWTPPEAAFKAADKVGTYLLVELPIWGEIDREMSFHNKFLNEDLEGIMMSYRHHPSFVMFSPGNELWGDISLMSEYRETAKALNPRILATNGSNLYMGIKGEIGNEDFIVASKIGDNKSDRLRGSFSFADFSDGGYFNSTVPNSSDNFSEATSGVEVPIISHEIGQYQIYPSFEGLDRYTGNLKPDNLFEFKRKALETHQESKLKEYAKNSGKWAAKLYKAELEMAQRTPGIAGFELFSIQDYTGQGGAFVGIMDPFMKSKNIITPEKWRQSSDDVTSLAKFPTFTFTTNQTVEIPLLFVNYSEIYDTIPNLIWETEFAQGKISITPGTGLIPLGNLSFITPEADSPEEYSLILRREDNQILNQYNFWVYPEIQEIYNEINITDNLIEALILLDNGETVILCPDTSSLSKASIPPLFITDFFNFKMWKDIGEEMNQPVSPGTLGLSIDKFHPALSEFPTESHTDWQWYPIIQNSRSLIIDSMPLDYEPIIEVIDNIDRQQRLAMLLELKVGEGNLLVLTADKDKIMDSPQGKWLIKSLVDYAQSNDFKPEYQVTPQQLINLLTGP